tara:strand:+ start:955 stop:1524 length:570 start_codon:yes stop_codon:yes gene_type:complete
MDNKEKKSKERAKYLKVREAVSKETKLLILSRVENVINEFLSKNDRFLHLGIYWPLDGEIDLRPLKNSLQVPFALPSCNKDGTTNYHSWVSGPLMKDAFGIPAPLKEPKLSPSEISVLLVPALAIDQNGVRLGYGGGFFDRLRVQPCWKSIISYVVLPKSCVSITPLPKDKWDIPFKRWITEDGEYKTI